jgi:hypothetical protein
MWRQKQDILLLYTFIILGYSMNYSIWHFSYCTWDPYAYAYTASATDNDEAKNPSNDQRNVIMTVYLNGSVVGSSRPRPPRQHPLTCIALHQTSAIGLLKHHLLHSCHIHKRNAPSNCMWSIDCFRSCSSLVAAGYHLPVVPTCGEWVHSHSGAAVPLQKRRTQQTPRPHSS